MLPLLVLPWILPACVEYSVQTSTRQDAFYQNELKAVDVLFVVDNSLSMAEEQVHLADNFGVLIDAFTAANVDWRLMVTTTETTPPWRGQLCGCTDEILLTRSDGLLLDRVSLDQVFTTDDS